MDSGGSDIVVDNGSEVVFVGGYSWPNVLVEKEIRRPDVEIYTRQSGVRM